MSIEDNDPTTYGAAPPTPDAHGQAALLLVESLIHGLLTRSLISIDDAIDILETAESVQVDIAEAADGASAPMWQSHALLGAIAASLQIDRDNDTTTLDRAPC